MCKCHTYTVLRMSFWPREILSSYLSSTSRAPKEPLNEKLHSTGEMCLHWMQNVQKEGHLPASHFNRPESRACVQLEILGLSLWLSSSYYTGNESGQVYGNGKVQPEFWQSPVWEMLLLPWSSAVSAPGPSGSRSQLCRDWKVLKALAKARFSKLPCVDLQPSGLQAVAGSLGSLAQLAASEPSPGSREKEECHSVG